MSVPYDPIDDMCRQADACYRSGDIQEARQIYEAILQMEPSHERAREGLALTSLTENRWSQVERSPGANTALAAGLAKARDFLSAGSLEQAQVVAEELSKQFAGQAEVAALVGDVAAARQRAPLTARALAEARDALSRGDARRAAAACRRALELEPGHREAEMLLEQSELSLNPASGELHTGDVPLEFDLDLAAEPSAPLFSLDVPPTGAAPVPAPPFGAAPAAPAAPAPFAAGAPSPFAAEAPTPFAAGAPAPFAAAPPASFAPEAPAPIAPPAAEPSPSAPQSGGFAFADATGITGPAGGPSAFALEAPEPTGPVPPAAPQGNYLDFGDLGGPYAVTAAPPAHEPQDRAVTDLLDAARDLYESRQQPAPTSPEGSAFEEAAPEQGEAALLVARGREEFENGHLDEARQLAARALAISDQTPGAQALLDEIQALAERAARDADDLLTQAIAEFERGRPDSAIPLLNQVLVLAPGHPEAVDYLRRAEQARAQQGLPPGEFGGAPAAPPAGEAASPFAGAQPLDVGAMPAEDVASIPIQAVRAAPVKSVDQRGAAWNAAPAMPTGPAPAVPLPPPPPPPRPARRTDAAPRPKPAVAAGSGNKVNPALVVGLAIALVGVGGWFGWQWWSGRQNDAAQEQIAVPAQARPKPKPKAEQKPAKAAAPSAADVPALVAKAQDLAAAGRAPEAVEALQEALRLDPNNYAVMDRLEKLKQTARAQIEASEKLKEARERWAQEDFEEALRLLYRLHEGYRPANLGRTIADGWYNAGVQRLQAMNFREATEFFNNCLEQNPGDDGAQRARETARRYQNKPTDDAFKAFAASLQIRPMR